MNTLNTDIARSIGIKKYITFLYWRLKIKNILTKNEPVEIEIIEINPNSDFARLLRKANSGVLDYEYTELIKKANK